MASAHLGPKVLGRVGRVGRQPRARNELLERVAPRGGPGPPRVTGGRPELQLELVGGLQALVRRQQRVGRRLAGVVDARIELRHSPTELKRGGQALLLGGRRGGRLAPRVVSARLRDLLAADGHASSSHWTGWACTIFRSLGPVWRKSHPGVRWHADAAGARRPGGAGRFCFGRR